MKTKTAQKQQLQNYNLLTRNVKHPDIAKQIVECILLDSGLADSTLDSLIMLFEAFKSHDNILDVKDFAVELQRYLFTKTIDCDSAVRDYVESVKKGRDYEPEFMHLLVG